MIKIDVQVVLVGKIHLLLQIQKKINIVFAVLKYNMILVTNN